MKYIIVFIFSLTGICESQAQVKFQKYVGMWATEFARSISICNDGTYLIGGYGLGAQFYHPYLVKMNTNGDTVWTRNYAGINGEELYACGQTFDGGYFIAVTTLANALYDYILIKTDS